MSVIFATSSKTGTSGNARTYTGAAVTRRANYTTEEIEATVKSNVTGDAFSIAFDEVGSAAGGDIWVHFRIKFPTDADNAAADGELLKLTTATDALVGAIDINNGNMRTSNRDNFAVVYGSEFSMDTTSVYTVDFHVSWDGANITTIMYVDGVSQSTSTGAYTLDGPVLLEFTLFDMLGVGTPDSPLYISELIIDDADSTIGKGLTEFEATADGATTDWSGDYTDIQDDGDETSINSGTDGAIQLWAGTYNGPNSGETIHAIVTTVNAITGATGPDAVTPIVRVGSTNYFGALEDIGNGDSSVWTYTWALNPADTAAWEPSDMSSLQFGVRADVV